MPTTPEGKAISSRNSTRHGCCSETLIVGDESEEQFNELKDGWLAEYDPQSEPALTLVLAAVKEYWFLLRAERWYNQTLQSLPGDPTKWDEPQHKSVERFTRYHTAKERSFHRMFNNLEHYRKSREKPKEPRKSGPGSEFPDHDAAKNGPTPNPEIRCLSPVSGPQIPDPPEEPFFTGKDSPKKRRKIVTLQQWVEITVDEQGNTVTELFPSNEELIKEGHTLFPPPELIYRFINFVDGVPPEYDWATAVVERRAAGGMGIQRMDVKTWLETIAREKAEGAGHIGPCGKPLPRPHERGECECPACTARYAGQT